MSWVCPRWLRLTARSEVGMALNAGARMIGVNNRNLKDFSVDTNSSRRLRADT